MQAKKKRLTLDMDPAFQRRLKATAALKGVSMRQYCLTAIEGKLDKDEVGSGNVEPSQDTDSVRFARVRKEVFGGRKLPGNSVDLLRDVREIRNKQMEEWLE